MERESTLIHIYIYIYIYMYMLTPPPPMTRADRDFQEKDMKFSLTGRLLSESCVALGSNSYCTPGLLFALFSYVQIPY